MYNQYSLAFLSQVQALLLLLLLCCCCCCCCYYYYYYNCYCYRYCCCCCYYYYYYSSASPLTTAGRASECAVHIRHSITWRPFLNRPIICLVNVTLNEGQGYSRPLASTGNCKYAMFYISDSYKHPCRGHFMSAFFLSFLNEIAEVMLSSMNNSYVTLNNFELQRHGTLYLHWLGTLRKHELRSSIAFVTLWPWPFDLNEGQDHTKQYQALEFGVAYHTAKFERNRLLNIRTNRQT